MFAHSLCLFFVFSALSSKVLGQNVRQERNPSQACAGYLTEVENGGTAYSRRNEGGTILLQVARAQ